MSETTPEPYSRTAWERAFSRWEAARAAKTAAEKLWQQANRDLTAAEFELANQEATPGVPAWHHLKLAPDPDACRIGRCSAHARLARLAAEAADEEPF